MFGFVHWQHGTFRDCFVKCVTYSAVNFRNILKNVCPLDFSKQALIMWCQYERCSFCFQSWISQLLMDCCLKYINILISKYILSMKREAFASPHLYFVFPILFAVYLIHFACLVVVISSTSNIPVLIQNFFANIQASLTIECDSCGYPQNVILVVTHKSWDSILSTR